MARHYLVVGEATDVGKTFLSSTLVKVLRKEGFKSCGFKPSGSTELAANADWMLDLLETGRLYGSDCAKLKTASESSLPEEVFGPNYMLTVNNRRWLADENSRYKVNALGPILVERYAKWNGVAIESVFIINKYETEQFGLEDLFRFPNAHIVSSLDEYQDLYSRHAGAAMKASYDLLMADHDAMVVEGRSNLASSWYVFDKDGCYHGIKQLDLVLFVGLFEVMCFSGQEYLEAVDRALKQSRINQIFPRSDSVLTKNIVKTLKPIKKFRYPLLRSREVSTLEGILRREVF